MICISEEAKPFIRDMIETETDNKRVLTLSSAGAGCGAPAIKLDMREPLEGDRIEQIDDLTFHIRPAIVKYLDGAEMVIEDSYWGKKLKVKTEFGCR